MKAVITYYSHKGHTANYAREIAMHLWSRGVSVSLCSLSDFDKKKAAEADILVLGCWTSGFFVVGQHPHKQWREFARSIAGEYSTKRFILFTTYKINTGSMFRRMRQALNLSASGSVLQLKSRTGKLTDQDRKYLDSYIQNNLHTP